MHGKTVVLIAVLVVLTARRVAAVDPAQDLPAPVGEFAVGWIGFPDGHSTGEILSGGAARWYLLPRLSAGPDVFYIHGDQHFHLIATIDVMVDLAPTVDNGRRHVTPFLVAGAGLFETRQSLPTGSFSAGRATFTMGGGVRRAIGDRLFIGADARIGWALNLRVNGLVGVRLGH